MFEKLVVKQCCNYNNGKCLGAMFKFAGKEGDKYRNLVQQIDKSKAGKQCLVTHCDFFMNYVLPALEKKEEYQKLISKYRQIVIESEPTPKPENEKKETKKYKLTCKKCGSKFETDVPQRKYCETCQKEVRKKNIRKAVKKHKNRLRVNTSASVTN